MKVLLALGLFAVTSSLAGPLTKTFHPNHNSRGKRQTVDPSEAFDLQPDELGQCMFVKTEDGVYSFQAPPAGGQEVVCGLYVITEPDQVIEFEFQEFDIGCSKGGLLSVIDGWELNGQFFPGHDDHPKPASQRFTEFCGARKPRKTFFMSQNVGLLMFRVPVENEGFRVAVRFKNNPKPCNVVYQQPAGIYTLRNYGRRSNCSVSIIFPESIQLLATSVGLQMNSRSSRNLDVETGLLRKCRKRGSEDFLEVRGGDGLDPGAMHVVEDLCGMDSQPSKRSLDIICGNTALRLVSSGRFENSVTFSFQLVVNLSSPAFVCPSLLNGL